MTKHPSEITEARLGILLGKRNYRALHELLIQMNAVDIAHFLNALPKEEAILTCRMLPQDLILEVFVELSTEQQTHLLESVTDGEIRFLFDELAVDDAVDLLEEMPSQLVARILKSTTLETRALLNRYLSYSEDSVGSIMTPEYTDLSKDMSAAQAIAHIRKVGEDRETIYTCYVIGPERLLEGVITVRDLLKADPQAIVADLMNTHYIAISTVSKTEEAAQMLQKYSMISLPVIDGSRHMVGIVTIDDAADVLQEEATEDLERLAGLSPSDTPYASTTVMQLAKNRFLWLLILMISGVLSEMVLGRYEAAISAIPLLVAFIPMLTDMGGDAGSQVSTLVVRGMALSQIRQSDMGAVLLKELSVSLMVSIPLGILNFARVILSHGNEPIVALAISLTLVATITMANLMGVILPMVAKRLRIDPAMMATPMIATLVDILSMMIYFAIAMALLSL